MNNIQRRTIWKHQHCEQAFLNRIHSTRTITAAEPTENCLYAAWSLPVTWQRWRSHHSIRRSRKLHASCKPNGSIFYRTGVMGDRSSHCGILYVFGSCDLDVDPMTFTYEPEPYCLELYWVRKYELPASRLWKVIVWQTYIHIYEYIQTESTDIYKARII